MSRSMRRVTAHQFDAVRPFLSSLAATRVENARRVMVDGELVQDIAAQEGISRNAISKLVRQVWEIMEANKIIVDGGSEVIPPGWHRLTLVAPLEFVEKVREDLAAYMRQREGIAPDNKP